MRLKGIFFIFLFAFTFTLNVEARKILSQAVTLKVMAAPSGGTLAQFSASMTSGQWADFQMGGLTLELMKAEGPSMQTFSLYAARGHWDALHKKIQFAGTSHTGGTFPMGAGALITWDALTNQWTKESYAWSSEDPGHTYFHLTLQPSTGDLYFRKFNSSNILRRSYGTTGQASWESGHVAAFANDAKQVAGGLEWFPELNNGNGGLVFADVFGASYSNSTLTSWTKQVGTSLSGPYHNWIAHAGAHVYFGGGNGSAAMYRMNASGVVTTMPNTPYEAGNNLNNSIVLPHPNGNELLLFQTAVGGAVQKFNGTSWQSFGVHQIGETHWIGTTIHEYGIILFIVHPGSTGAPYARVYKP